MMGIAALATLIGAGGIAWWSKQREERMRDLGRAQSPNQGEFFEGVNEEGENVWSYAQEDGSVVLVVEPPRFANPDDPNFEGWYRRSAFFGRVPIEVFRRQLQLPWQESFRALLAFTAEDGGAIVVTEIKPDPEDMTRYTVANPPMVIADPLPPESDGEASPVTDMVHAPMGRESREDRFRRCCPSFDIGLFEGFVESLPAYSAEEIKTIRHRFL